MKILIISALTSAACALFPMTTFASASDLEITQDNEISIGDVNTETERYNYNFGRVRVNRSATASFSIRNRSSIPVYINDIDISGGGFRKNDNCPRLLTRGNSCQVRVRFEPWNTSDYRGRLDINLTPNEDIRVDLRGRGVRNNGNWNE
jgi:hypothetical protein